MRLRRFEVLPSLESCLASIAWSEPPFSWFHLVVTARRFSHGFIKKEQANGRGFLVISHYARLYDLIKPTRAVVMINGRIVVDGGPDVFKRIDQTGYEFIKTELGISIEKEELEMNKISIGSCAVKDAIK